MRGSHLGANRPAFRRAAVTVSDIPDAAGAYLFGSLAYLRRPRIQFPVVRFPDARLSQLVLPSKNIPDPGRSK